MWTCVQEAFAFAINVLWEGVSRRNTWCFMIWNQLTMAQLIKKTLHNIDKKWFTNFALCSFTINGILQRNLWNIAHYYGLLQLGRSHYIGRFVFKDYYKVSRAFQSFQYQGKMNSHRNSFVSSDLMNIIIINIKKSISRCCMYVHGCVLQLQVYCRLLIRWCSKGKRSASIVLTIQTCDTIFLVSTSLQR